jgi:hypothetical protein
VRQLVREQLVALFGSGREFAVPKMDVGAGGECAQLSEPNRGDQVAINGCSSMEHRLSEGVEAFVERLVRFAVLLTVATACRRPDPFESRRHPVLLDSTYAWDAPRGAVSVLDVRVEKATTTTEWPPTKINWACISFSLANETQSLVAVLDGLGMMEGFQTQWSEHREELDWTLRDGPGPDGRSDCHGMGINLAVIPRGGRLRLGICDTLVDWQQSPPKVYDLSDLERVDVVVGWMEAAADMRVDQYRCSCTASCRLKVGAQLAHLSRGSWSYSPRSDRSWRWATPN